MAMLNMGGGLDFDSESNTKDVMWLGNCDEGCQLLADKLGWGVSQFNVPSRKTYNNFPVFALE